MVSVYQWCFWRIRKTFGFCVEVFVTWRGNQIAKSLPKHGIPLRIIFSRRHQKEIVLTLIACLINDRSHSGTCEQKKRTHAEILFLQIWINPVPVWQELEKLLSTKRTRKPNTGLPSFGVRFPWLSFWFRFCFWPHQTVNWEPEKKRSVSLLLSSFQLFTGKDIQRDLAGKKRSVSYCRVLSTFRWQGHPKTPGAKQRVCECKGYWKFENSAPVVQNLG